MTMPLPAGTYRLDQHHSQIGFTVTHLGLTPVRGLFPDFDGELRLGDRLAGSSLAVSITMASVQSGHAGRDQHLQIPDYFDSASHPTMTFESTSIDAAGDGWVVDGTLTIKGITRPLQLSTVMTGQRVFPLDEKPHIGFVATGRLSRLAFGVAPEVPDEMLSDEIALDLAVQLIPD